MHKKRFSCVRFLVFFSKLEQRISNLRQRLARKFNFAFQRLRFFLVAARLRPRRTHNRPCIKKRFPCVRFSVIFSKLKQRISDSRQRLARKCNFSFRTRSLVVMVPLRRPHRTQTRPCIKNVAPTWRRPRLFHVLSLAAARRRRGRLLVLVIVIMNTTFVIRCLLHVGSSAGYRAHVAAARGLSSEPLISTS